MKKHLTTTLFLLFTFLTMHAQPTYPTLGKVHYDDPRLEKLIPKTRQLGRMKVPGRHFGHKVFTDMNDQKRAKQQNSGQSYKTLGGAGFEKYNLRSNPRISNRQNE
jgi:hypothetical protein